MSYEEWMILVNRFKGLHEIISEQKDTPLDSHTVHAAMMLSDQAKWVHELIVDMMYKQAAITIKHEATS